MDVGPPRAAVRGPAQTMAHVAEGPLDGEAVQCRSPIGTEEELRSRSVREGVPPGGIAQERLNAGGVKGNEPRLTELAGADGQHPVGEVGVTPFEVAGLGEPQAG